jgi:AraC-like DNA-binding protein
LKYKNFTYKDHINKEHHITAHKKNFGGHTGIHFHEFFEIEIAIDGFGSCMFNGNEYVMKRGTGYILTPADFHYLSGKDNLMLYNIMFDESIVNKELLVKLFENEKNRYFSFSEKQLKEISLLCEALIKERNEENEYNSFAVNNLLELIIIYILRKIGKSENKGNRTSLVINNVLRYIYTHLRENPTLAQMAEMCNYSPNYFSRLFKDTTGKKYTDFLNSLKINTAKRLLSSSDISVKEIAQECGYSSVSNFYRVFKEETGIAPLTFRRSKNDYEK